MKNLDEHSRKHFNWQHSSAYLMKVYTVEWKVYTVEW